MKKTLIYITLGVAGVLASTGCDKWLEATSATQIKASDLLASRTGFQDALSGVYITMGNTSTYGGGLTWKSSDMAAYPYEKMRSTSELAWQSHNYEAAPSKSTISGIWSGNYNTIANINFLLREIKTRRDLFSNLEFDLFKGELMGLRAMLHFDIMRYFGVAEWSDGHKEKLTIPYVTEYSATVTDQRIYSETIAMLKSDLDSAITYLAKDPARGNLPKDFDIRENSEGFWNHREKHFNYYAAKMLQARIFQWENNFEKEAETAQEIIDEALAGTGFVKWVDAEEQRTINDASQRDWTFSTEHIFSLEVSELGKKTISYLMTNTFSDGLRCPVQFIEETLFPATDEYGSIAGAEDLRGPAWQLSYNSVGYDPCKLYQPNGYAKEYKSRMPLMKLSELYYMIAENHIENGENAEAIKAINEVRRNRGVSDPLPDEADAVTELAKEYYREFICEGQIFCLLKHSHLKYQLNAEFALTENDLIYPYPQTERDYGRKQEL